MIFLFCLIFNIVVGNSCLSQLPLLFGDSTGSIPFTDLRYLTETPGSLFRLKKITIC